MILIFFAILKSGFPFIKIVNEIIVQTESCEKVHVSFTIVSSAATNHYLNANIYKSVERAAARRRKQNVKRRF